MRKMVLELPVVFIGMVVVGLVITGTSHAGVNLDTCIGAWLFDDGSGNVATDSSGNGNDGEILDATWADGKFGGALEFDGVSSQVTIPDSDVLNNVDESPS